MKVIKTGYLYVDAGLTRVNGWEFELDGPLPTGSERERVVLRAVLMHLARRHGVQLSAPPVEAEPVASIDVERLTLDVIAQARWEALP